MRLDGKPRLSCRTQMGSLAGSKVVTLVGVDDPVRSTLAHAFVECGAVQCGFCTPGMIMRSVELLNDNPNPSEEEIRWGISGNLCRCTGYVNIVKAVQYASKKMAEGVPA